MSDYIYGRLLSSERKILGKRGILVKEVSGPDSYETGGFEINLGEIKKIEKAFVVITNDNTTYKLETTFKDNKVKVKVNEIKFVTDHLEVTEIADGTNLSSLKFLVKAFVH